MQICTLQCVPTLQKYFPPCEGARKLAIAQKTGNLVSQIYKDLGPVSFWGILVFPKYRHRLSDIIRYLLARFARIRDKFILFWD